MRQQADGPRRVGGERPTREHYEAQLIAADGVDGAMVSALEIGFHAEHPDAEENDAAIARLMAGQDRWRERWASGAVVGAFLGRFPDWRRVLEAWPDPDLDDPDLPVQVALRLTDYIDALEPLRRQGLIADHGGRRADSWRRTGCPATMSAPEEPAQARDRQVSGSWAVVSARPRWGGVVVAAYHPAIVGDDEVGDGGVVRAGEREGPRPARLGQGWPMTPPW